MIGMVDLLCHHRRNNLDTFLAVDNLVRMRRTQSLGEIVGLTSADIFDADDGMIERGPGGCRRGRERAVWLGGRPGWAPAPEPRPVVVRAPVGRVGIRCSVGVN